MFDIVGLFGFFASHWIIVFSNTSLIQYMGLRKRWFDETFFHETFDTWINYASDTNVSYYAHTMTYSYNASFSNDQTNSFFGFLYI